jgi:hypothetical protein
MNIAIDSASSLSYTGVLSCSLSDLVYFYEKLEEILAERNIYPPFHWRNLTNRIREAVKPDIESLFNSNYPKVNFNFFLHKKPLNVELRKIIYEDLPKAIADNLFSWLIDIKGTLVIEVHNDFRVRNYDDLTFNEKLINNIIPILTNKTLTIKRVGNSFMTTVKKDGKRLNIVCALSDSESSKGIQIADIILGYSIRGNYIFKRERFHKRIIC